MLDIIPSDSNMRSFKSMANIEANTKFGIERGLFRLGKDLIQSFNRQTKERKSGVLYGVPGRRRRVRASGPGQSPAVRTGLYKRSVGYKISGDKMRFGNAAEYAGFLETGTSRMLPRPGLGNAIKDNQRNGLLAISDSIESKL